MTVKETATTGWVYLPDYAEWAGTQTVTTLPGIGRHDTPSRSGWPDRQSEADFLARYRRHVIEYHGMLEPPDFEYRRRVPVADLYVPPAIVQIIRSSAELPPREVTLEQFSEEIGRTVLLGDPGSGKTTAVQVLMHDQAANANGRVPFMVTLREFATGETQRSVAGYLQDKLDGFYQCPAPPGSVERLLLSGAALVIFDGLDELADTMHRGNLTAIIERFCAEYPQAAVLVTSRLVGYEPLGSTTGSSLGTGWAALMTSRLPAMSASGSRKRTNSSRRRQAARPPRSWPKAKACLTCGQTR